jgi:hypothetical protein
MSAVIVVANTAEVALTAATAKTIIQVASVAHRPIKVKEWGVFFDGVSVTEAPVQVRLIRQSTAGTMSALTPIERTITGVTIQETCLHTATVEPTLVSCVAAREVHPQSGYQEKFSFGDEIVVGGAAIGRIAIECTAPATVNVRGEIVYEA